MFIHHHHLLLLPFLLTLVQSKFNHHLDTDSTPYSRSLAFEKSWNSEECQRFYHKDYFSTVEDEISCNQSNEIVNCPKNQYTDWFPPLKGEEKRWSCKKGEITHHRDVLIGHKQKIIFVNVTKSASSSIRQILQLNFQISDRRDQESIKLIPINQIDDYFIFTFVRDPLLRMESGIGQAQRQGVQHTHPQILDFLSKGCIVDKHVWSIARYLNIKLADGSPIKYDFIGSLENIDQDMNLLLPILKMDPHLRKAQLKRSEKPTNVSPIRRANIGASHFHSSLNYRDPNIVNKMCRLLMQDYACLGEQYSPPPMCLNSNQKFQNFIKIIN